MIEVIFHWIHFSWELWCCTEKCLRQLTSVLFPLLEQNVAALWCIWDLFQELWKSLQGKGDLWRK
jgi:hypothetical protein